MSNQLSKQAPFWYRFINRYHLDTEIKQFLPSIQIEEEIRVNIGWYNRKVILPKLFCEIARKFWQNVDRKTTSPYKLLYNNFPSWVIFGLPRRPAMVLFAAYQRILQVRFDDYENYIAFITPRRFFYRRFMRSQLQIYKLTQPFRKILGLSVKDRKSERYVDLPSYVEDVLLAYSTPGGIFHQIAEFQRERTLQQSISLVRALEEYSSKLSSAESVDEIISATNDFNQRRTYLGNFEITLNQPEVVNYNIFKNQDFVEGIVQRYFKENYSEIIKKMPQETDKNEDGANLEQQYWKKIQQIEKRIEKMDFQNDPYNTKRTHYRARKLFKYWRKFDKVVLHRPNTNTWRMDDIRVLEYYICQDNDYFVVTSRTNLLSRSRGYLRRSWLYNPKYYRWFNTYENAENWLNQKVDKKLARYKLKSMEKLLDPSEFKKMS